ncbi:hypothetical protein AFL01nite_13520 [Aeromicrobium flavum]|uniref:Rhodanese domain-containing protein n=1 Tax=Aeromicrobium flavum TaxID=416568 RepID=A0A512HUA7_9ACTN|nr:rhodanese-like domain-containing protein [Aeromicrobium flavum]GEO89025.1 hypothetical protein AFL01nite_13520 [Aeromicrobium flavum]
MSQDTPEISIDVLATATERHATVIDVRQPSEYAEGHVPGAALIPMGMLPSRFGDIDATRPVYVVCASGNRSSAMTDLLVSQGFDAYSVVGGTSAWVRSGRPVETGVPPRD